MLYAHFAAISLFNWAVGHAVVCSVMSRAIYSVCSLCVCALVSVPVVRCGRSGAAHILPFNLHVNHLSCRTNQVVSFVHSLKG